jgi:hypothetical protein
VTVAVETGRLWQAFSMKSGTGWLVTIVSVLSGAV